MVAVTFGAQYILIAEWGGLIVVLTNDEFSIMYDKENNHLFVVGMFFCP